MSLLRRFRRGNDGPTWLEYAVMAALIVADYIVAIRSIGTAPDKYKCTSAVAAPVEKLSMIAAGKRAL